MRCLVKKNLCSKPNILNSSSKNPFAGFGKVPKTARVLIDAGDMLFFS